MIVAKHTQRVDRRSLFLLQTGVKLQPTHPVELSVISLMPVTIRWSATRKPHVVEPSDDRTSRESILLCWDQFFYINTNTNAARKTCMTENKRAQTPQAANRQRPRHSPDDHLTHGGCRCCKWAKKRRTACVTRTTPDATTTDQLLAGVSIENNMKKM